MIQLFLYNQIMIKILLAEDNQDWLCLQKTLLEEYFGKDEYGICFAKNARTALNCLKQEKYDAVITDLQMESDFIPEFAGEWLVKQMRELDDYKDTPVLLVSATYNIGFIAEKLGVKYLSKRTLVAAPDIYRCAMNDLLGLNKK